MKKLSYVMLAGMVFFFVGWTFTLTYEWLYGTLACTIVGWIATKIDEERS